MLDRSVSRALGRRSTGGEGVDGCAVVVFDHPGCGQGRAQLGSWPGRSSPVLGSRPTLAIESRCTNRSVNARRQSRLSGQLLPPSR